MLTIQFHKGLPGSGKTTDALRQVRESKCSIVRVNKDDLRAMLHAGRHSRRNEEFVLALRDSIIRNALIQGKHVIVDDTNFEPKHRASIDAIAQEMRDAGRDVQVVERFFDTPLEECIANDLKRLNSVGEKVIRGMYNKHLRPPVVPATIHGHVEGMPHCIIIDIDGTLARMKDRGPFEWEKVGQDELHTDIAHLVNAYDCGNHGRTIHKFLLSGRDGVCRPETELWLKTHGIEYDRLLMRPTGNTEKDAVIKERLYLEHIAGKYNVDFVLDDRDQVVQLWRSLGLRCLQVAEGNF